MTRRQRLLRRGLAGYVAVLFGTLPFALSCWNGWLQGLIGQFVTVEMIHVGQYIGLGWLATSYARAGECTRRSRIGLGSLVMGVGVGDELVQGYLPQRFFQWSDVWLNWVGLALGVAGAEAVRRLKRSRRRAAVKVRGWQR